jgi:hypothetical protein
MVRTYSIVGLLLAATAWCQQVTVRRDGPYWVEQRTGSCGDRVIGVLRVAMRGPVSLNGGAPRQCHYVLTKRVRAASEAQARRIFAQLQLRTVPARTGTSVELVAPAREVALAELELTVPRTLSKVAVETDAGDVSIRNIQGVVWARSGAGVIALDGIGGSADVRTGGGEIRIGRVEQGVRSATEGGSISVTYAGGQSYFETAGGEIEILEVGGPVHASTGGGNIRVESSAGSVYAKTTSGRIEVQRAEGIVVAGNSGGSVQVGRAAGVEVESTGGGIQLRGSSGAIRAVSDVGSIFAELRPGSHLSDSVLTSHSGDITVFIPANLALTIRALNESGRTSNIISEFQEIAIRHVHAAREALAEGMLNGGGPVLKISSERGRIYLRRAATK